MKNNIYLTGFIASLALLFTACGGAANSTTTGNNANKTNTAMTTTSTQTSPANPATPAVTAASPAAATKDDGKIVGDYMVGDVKCTIKPEAKDTKDLYFEVKCADNRKVEVYSRDDDATKKQAILVAGKNRFVFENNPSASGTFNSSEGTFTDDKGKSVKVTRAK